MELQVHNHLLKSSSWTKPTNLYFALCSGATVSANTGANLPEFAFAAGYARVNYGAPADSGWQVHVTDTGGANTLVIQFPTCITTGWGLVSGVALLDATTNGNMLMFGNLTTARTVSVGDAPFFASGNLNVKFD